MKSKENNTIIIQLLIALLIIVVEGATDIFTPSLPAIKKYFDSTEKIIQWTVSINLIGISISSLFYGPLSDAVGRRKVILFGGFIFLVGSICCGFAQNVFSLIFFRFIQGIGGGVAIVVGFASIRDLFTGAVCSRVLSRIEMVVAISPGIAPVAGSYIARYLNWHFTFYFISILAFVTLLVNYYFFYETIGEKKKTFSFPSLMLGYFVLLKNPGFWCFLLIQTLIFTRVFAETANLPFVYVSMWDGKTPSPLGEHFSTIG
jgi:MFS transporter, DHA1 family, multidrug resistance protein